MTRNSPKDMLGPLSAIVRLGQRAIRLRLALLRADLVSRGAAMGLAVLLLSLAVTLLILATGLLVEAGLLGLAQLGLTPLQALLTVALACVVLALALIALALSRLRRAARPLAARRDRDLPDRRS